MSNYEALSQHFNKALTCLGGLTMYQQESCVTPMNIANICNRIVRQGGEIVTILPNIDGQTTYIIIYKI